MHMRGAEMQEKSKTACSYLKMVLWTFRSLLFLYALLLMSIFLYIHTKLKVDNPDSLRAIDVGIVLGAIFVIISFYYYYENYLLPFKKEQNHPGQGMISILFAWIIPAITIQLFIVAGFSFTAYESKFKGTMYVESYRYSQIYKQYEQLSSDMTDDSNEKRNALLTKVHEEYINKKEGSNEEKEIERYIYSIPYMIALTFGFLGVLIYCLQDLVHRIYTKDLYPKTLISYLIRFVFAPALCLVIAYSLMDNWLVNVSPLIFFITGVFPQRALRSIEAKAISLGLKPAIKDKMPLGDLQGMTEYLDFRFNELGIADVQNLATVDLNYLRSNFGHGYSNRLLADFVSQSMLYLFVKQYFNVLQNAGIRDIFSFIKRVREENFEDISKVLGIPSANLKGALDLIKDENTSKRIRDLENFVHESENKSRM